MAATAKSRKQFTVDQANQMLPLVRAITQDLVALSQDVIERQQRVETLKAGREMACGDPYDDELAHSIAELDKDKIRLQGYIDELRDLGVVPKSGTEGLVDFPGLLDGRPVFLCWQLGEPEVLYWHDLDAGFDGRQPLPVSVSDE